MDKKKTVWERVKVIWQAVWEVLVLPLLIFGGVLSLVLFVMLFGVTFNDSVEIFAKRTLGTESEQDVVVFIVWSMVGVLMFLIIVAVNNSVVAQAANYDMEKAKELWRRLAVYLLVYVGGVGLFSFVVFFSVIFSDVVEYRTEGSLGVIKKWDAIQSIGWCIIGILAFLSVASVIRWVAIQVENNTEEMNELWRRVIFGFLLFVGVLGVGLFILLMMVIFVAGVEDEATRILGISGDMRKREVIEFIGLGIAGILAIFGAVAVSKRAEAQVKNNELVEKGHIQERFKAAVGHLGSKDESERIASFYEFFHLASDNKGLRKNIFDILRAHLRLVTTNPKYREKVIENDRTTEEVQCLLDVLFRSTNRQGEFIFSGLESTLREIFLVQANLYKANLQDVKLQNVDLRGANLQKANLQGVVLQKLSLQTTNSEKARLHVMDFDRADLREADLRGANLKEAKNLKAAKLSGAKVKNAEPPEEEGFEWPEDVIHD